MCEVRQAEPFGHGINIKGRVNIINNLRYNGPSGAGNKFVDTKWGKVERLSLFVKADQGKRDGIASRAPIGRLENREESTTERDDFSSIS